MFFSRRTKEELAEKNIGVAEQLFLMRLRFSVGDELKEAVNFLREFGVTDKTIAKIQLAPEDEALKALQSVIYNDKLKFKSFYGKANSQNFLSCCWSGVVG